MKWLIPGIVSGACELGTRKLSKGSGHEICLESEVRVPKTTGNYKSEFKESLLTQ